MRGTVTRGQHRHCSSMSSIAAAAATAVAAWPPLQRCRGGSPAGVAEPSVAWLPSRVMARPGAERSGWQRGRWPPVSQRLCRPQRLYLSTGFGCIFTGCRPRTVSVYILLLPTTGRRTARWSQAACGLCAATHRLAFASVSAPYRSTRCRVTADANVATVRLVCSARQPLLGFADGVGHEVGRRRITVDAVMLFGMVLYKSLRKR